MVEEFVSWMAEDMLADSIHTRRAGDFMAWYVVGLTAKMESLISCGTISARARWVMCAL